MCLEVTRIRSLPVALFLPPAVVCFCHRIDVLLHHQDLAHDRKDVLRRGGVAVEQGGFHWPATQVEAT